MDGLNMRRPTQLVAALPHSDVSVSFKPDSKRECFETLPRPDALFSNLDADECVDHETTKMRFIQFSSSRKATLSQEK